jgi:outer membrane protein assembly factor BamB
VKCLDEATGRLLWELPIPRFETDKKNFNFDDMDLGICSSPTVDGDRVYLVTNRCEALCLDVRGHVVWRYDMIAQLPCWPQDAASASILVSTAILLTSAPRTASTAPTTAFPCRSARA